MKSFLACFRPRVLWAIGLVVLILVGSMVLVPRFHARQQPSYNGIQLTTWLEDFAEGKPGAELAIRQIGTNAVPTLLELLRQQDSQLKKHLLRTVSYERLSKFNFRSALHCELLASKGFEALSEVGNVAIPELLELVNRPKSSLGAASALVAIGPQGVKSLTVKLVHEDRDVRRTVAAALGAVRSPSECVILDLLTSLNDKDFTVRSAAATALGQLHAHPNLVVPALMTRIQDTNRIVRFAAVQALGNFGKEARFAIDAISSATNDIDMLVRQAAHSALHKAR